MVSEVCILLWIETQKFQLSEYHDKSHWHSFFSIMEVFLYPFLTDTTLLLHRVNKRIYYILVFFKSTCCYRKKDINKYGTLPRCPGGSTYQFLNLFTLICFTGVGGREGGRRLLYKYITGASLCQFVHIFNYQVDSRKKLGSIYEIIKEWKYFNQEQPLHHMSWLIFPSNQLSSTVLLLIFVVPASFGKGFSLRAESSYILGLRRRVKLNDTNMVMSFSFFSSSQFMIYFHPIIIHYESYRDKLINNVICYFNP